MWSPYQQPDSVGDLEGRVEDKSRSLYTHEEYISLVLNSGSGLSHDYVSQSEQEDPRMMAFFDSLVRREIEGWSSDSDSDLSEGAILQLHARGRGHTQATNHGASTNQTPPTEATSNRQSDSDHSSSSSSSSSLLSGLASGSERVDPNAIGLHRQRRAGSQRASTFLLDVVNEDSDSSSFWLDPLPRPRSPSPRENSSLSRTSSPSSSPSSSSTTSSNSDEEAELQRSRVRQRNAARRQDRTRWSRLDSTHSLQSATDYSSYPKISLHDSTSSSSGDENQPIRSEGKNEGHDLTSSPGPSSESRTETRLRVRGRFTEVIERAESRIGQREELGAGQSSEEELNSSGLYGNLSTHDESCVDSTLPESSEGVEPDTNSTGSRTEKRTRFRSEAEGEEPSSEKKLKT